MPRNYLGSMQPEVYSTERVNELSQRGFTELVQLDLDRRTKMSVESYLLVSGNIGPFNKEGEKVAGQWLQDNWSNLAKENVQLEVLVEVGVSEIIDRYHIFAHSGGNK